MKDAEPRNWPKSESLSVGVVLRRQPGVTRWAKWVWRAVALLPGAGPADWRELRREGEAVEYHAATVPVEVHRTETDAYRVALSTEPPTAWVILRPVDGAGGPEDGPDHAVYAVTVSPFEAQDYQDTAEEIVEPVPMPPALIAWLSDFVGRHHEDEEFRKRRRDRVDVDRHEDGKGDARVVQVADVYRSPASLKKRRLQ